MADISLDFENARAAARESQSVGDDVKSSVAGVDDSCNDAALGLLVGPLVTPPTGSCSPVGALHGGGSSFWSN